MFTSYLISSFRNILNNKFTSLINIVGLSLGISSILIIILFLRFEYSYDNFHPNEDRLYRILNQNTNQDRTTLYGYCPALAGSEIFEALPGIENMVRISQSQSGYLKSNELVQKSNDVLFVDSSFFDVLGFKLLQGSANKVLRNPDDVILSESFARKIFGNDNVIGKTVDFSGKEFLVNGIVADPPDNSHIQFDALFSFKSLKYYDHYLGWDGGLHFETILLLENENLKSDTENRISEFLENKVNKHIRQYGWEVKYYLQNIRDIHLESSTDWDYSSNKSTDTLRMAGFLGLLILIIAILNYVNLGTAQSFKRAKEIGLRKISGSNRTNLMIHFIWESVLICILAMIPTVIIYELASPFIDKLLETQLSLYSKENLVILPLIILIPVITGLIAGFYPALALSAFPPLKMFQLQKSMFSSKSTLRNVFVVVQFVISSVLIVVSIIFYQQLELLENKRLGFDREMLAYVSFRNSAGLEKQINYKNELKSIPEIENLSLVSQIPGHDFTQNGYEVPGQEGLSLIKAIYVDADFIPCCNIELVKGRNFRTDPTNNPYMLVNESLVKQMGMENPLDIQIKRGGLDYGIIGVVKDFNFAPLTKKVQPLVISNNPSHDGWNYYAMLLRINPQSVKTAKAKAKRIWGKHFPGDEFIFGFVDDYINRAYASEVNFKKFILIFTGIAILIACFGLLGLSVYMLDQKMKQVGVMKVLGASLGGILSALVKDMFKLILLANIIACPIAWYFGKEWLNNYAYRIGISPWVFVIACISSIMIAIVVISGKTLRTARLNPVDVLKYE